MQRSKPDHDRARNIQLLAIAVGAVLIATWIGESATGMMTGYNAQTLDVLEAAREASQ